MLAIFAAGFMLAISNLVKAETLEPEVVITDKSETTIQEFRANGQVYMIKVTPKKGPAYFLVDSNGDGELDIRRNELEPKMLIPSWVLFSW